VVGKPRARWKDNIKIEVRETGWGGVKVIHPAQDRDKWRALVKQGNEPSGSIKFWEILE
jgi:hypothetical protein